MNTPKNISVDYFETDQIKYAAQLWKEVKKIQGPDFDIIQFTHNWAYADRVIAQSLTVPDEGVSTLALEIMQLRLLFVQKYPERAKKLGAMVADTNTATKPQEEAPKKAPESPPEPSPESPKRYLKGLR